jgi:hypothetical protein
MTKFSFRKQKKKETIKEEEKEMRRLIKIYEIGSSA